MVKAAAARHNTLVMVCRELRPDRPRLIVVELPSPIAPKRTQKPPAAYWYGLLASGGWLVGWPVLYAFVESTVPKNAAFYSLSHAAATLWFFSLIAFFVFLALLAEYSPTASCIWEGLTFLIDALSLFVWF
jgi:hypothetical protein